MADQPFEYTNSGTPPISNKLERLGSAYAVVQGYGDVVWATVL